MLDDDVGGVGIAGGDELQLAIEERTVPTGDGSREVWLQQAPVGHEDADRLLVARPVKGEGVGAERVRTRDAAVLVGVGTRRREEVGARGQQQHREQGKPNAALSLAY